MKKLLIFIFSFISFAALGQVEYDSVSVVDPQDFTEAASIDTADIQFISRKNNLNRRVNPATLRSYVSTDVWLGWPAVAFDTTGNSSTYYFNIVPDSTGDVWYIDAIGRGRQLEKLDLQKIDTAYMDADTLYLVQRQYDDTFDTTSVTISGGGGGGTDDQTLTLSNDSLSIESANKVVFSGWDTNASDDFSGAWGDLTSVPSGFADDIDDVGVDFTDSLTTFVTPTQLSDSLSNFSATDTSGYNTALNLSGTTLQLTDGDGTLSQDLSSLQDGTGTDDQTLAEVLTQGNTANLAIDLNGNNLANVNDITLNTTGDDWAIFNNGPYLQFSQTGAISRLSLTGAVGTDISRLGVGGIAVPAWELDVNGVANADTIRVDGSYYLTNDIPSGVAGDTSIMVWTDSTTAFFLDKSEFGGAGGSADGDGIYDGSGSLTDSTVVNQGGFRLAFFNGNVGIVDTTPSCALDVANVFRVQGVLNPGYPLGSTETGFEIAFDTDAQAIPTSGSGGDGAALFQSYDRGNGVWEDLWFRGREIVFDTKTIKAMHIDSTGSIDILNGALDLNSNNLNNVAQLSIDATTLDWVLDGDGTTLDFRRGGTDYMRLGSTGSLTLTSGDLALSGNDLNGVGNFQVGATTDTTDGSGDITVSHGHSGTPSSVHITIAGGGTPLIPVVGTVNGTNFTVRFYNTSGTAVTSTSVSFYWTAR